MQSMGDEYYSIHPPGVVQMLDNLAPPSPLSSAPNTPISDHKRSKNHFSDSENEAEPVIVNPPKVSRKLLPPSIRSPTYSKLPSHLTTPQVGVESSTKKKKLFMKKADVPFDETPLSVPTLECSATERTLRILKGEAKKYEPTRSDRTVDAVPGGKVHNSRSHRSSLSSSRPVSKAVHFSEEAPDDERFISKRNILAEMDDLEETVTTSKRNFLAELDELEVTIINSQKNNSSSIVVKATKPDSSIQRKNVASQHSKESRSGSNVKTMSYAISRGTLLDEPDEFMVPKTPTPARDEPDESMIPKSPSGASGELMHHADEDDAVSVSTSDDEDGGVLVTTEGLDGSIEVAPISGKPSNLEEKKTESEPMHLTTENVPFDSNGTNQLALPSGISVLPFVDRDVMIPALSLSCNPFASVAEPEISLLEREPTEMYNNIDKIQEVVSQDLISSDEIKKEVTFSSILFDAAYFSSVAASGLAAAGMASVDAAGEAVENMVLGPPQVVQAIPGSVSTDIDDDTTEVTKNFSEGQDAKKKQAGEIHLSSIEEDSSEYAPPPPTSPPRAGPFSTIGGNADWWLERELARRDREQKVQALAKIHHEEGRLSESQPYTPVSRAMMSSTRTSKSMTLCPSTTLHLVEKKLSPSEERNLNYCVNRSVPVALPDKPFLQVESQKENVTNHSNDASMTAPAEVAHHEEQPHDEKDEKHMWSMVDNHLVPTTNEHTACESNLILQISAKLSPNPSRAMNTDEEKKEDGYDVSASQEGEVTHVPDSPSFIEENSRGDQLLLNEIAAAEAVIDQPSEVDKVGGPNIDAIPEKDGTKEPSEVQLQLVVSSSSEEQLQAHISGLNDNLDEPVDFEIANFRLGFSFSEDGSDEKERYNMPGILFENDTNNNEEGVQVEREINSIGEDPEDAIVLKLDAKSESNGVENVESDEHDVALVICADFGQAVEIQVTADDEHPTSESKTDLPVTLIQMTSRSVNESAGEKPKDITMVADDYEADLVSRHLNGIVDDVDVNDRNLRIVEIDISKEVDRIAISSEPGSVVNSDVKLDVTPRDNEQSDALVGQTGDLAFEIVSAEKLESRERAIRTSDMAAATIQQAYRAMRASKIDKADEYIQIFPLGEGSLGDPMALDTLLVVASDSGDASGEMQTCNSEVMSIASAGTERLSNKAPLLVKSLDNVAGICKGDILLSLLHLKDENESPLNNGAAQVCSAVWRMRSMRRYFSLRKTGELCGDPTSYGMALQESLPYVVSNRSTIPVDLDNMHVFGKLDQIGSVEESALNHLRCDEFDDALELYDDILNHYRMTFEERKWDRIDPDRGNFGVQLYIGNTLHNMGILNFLKRDFKEASSCFQKAVENRKSRDGTPNSDELASAVKLALCQYALGNFSNAHSALEVCLEASKDLCDRNTDIIQIAEILNNLGCLSFTGGDSVTALKMFAESLKVQQSVLRHSLYGDSALVGHATNLNISIIRANTAFVKSHTKDYDSAIGFLERALATQQLLLYDSHETILNTMDLLANANQLAGYPEKTIKMLDRMRCAQIRAHGAEDSRCEMLRLKISVIQANMLNITKKKEVPDDTKKRVPEDKKKLTPENPQTVEKPSKSPPRLLRKFTFRKNSRVKG